ncbi:riboflavin kinase / FMN adenylyltransferase [Bryocella elongata]|uniref:Riboflavin biosynthesis protein n=1 Tax=Bryocella elongata TaxID=863522 RepID=A0A1H6B733_9BACT|nr:riboflavin biosynthesis protein RibF [Bryocella elongata]SEG56618.1 riboflavin kinase / FMN adenylyltransferase [Bryocella elongata]
MKIYRSLSELPQDAARSVVTIGNFDGVHCGHRAVIASVQERAHALNAQSIAVTFDPHPAVLLRPDKAPKLLTPTPVNLELLAATGLDATLVLPFNEELRHWTAEHFARTVLSEALGAVEVHEGEEFRFGYDRQGGMATLMDMGRTLGFEAHPHQPVMARGGAISSSRIRALLTENLATRPQALAEARALLGRPFSVHSTPAHGRGFGTKYAVPTINIASYSGLLPANGVYVTTLRIGAGAEAKLFRGVTNAGNRPTFGEDSFAVETHLFGFEPVTLFEDTPLELTFLLRLRSEQKFDSPDALKTQIFRDVKRAQRYFALSDLLAPRP